MPSGGYRKPAEPAPASGPGRLSRRTDGGPSQAMRDLPDAAYGEQASFREQQAGAPMAMAESALRPSPGEGGSAPVDVVPFGAPSNRPDEPITAGAPVGLGPGPEALGLTTEEELLKRDKQYLANYLPVLEFLANRPNAMPSLRSMVRKIRAAVNS